VTLGTNNGVALKILIVSAAAIAAAAFFIPTPSNAQIGFGVPGFGVQIGRGAYGGYGGGPYCGGYGHQQPYYGGYRPYSYDEGVAVQPRVYSDYDEPVVPAARLSSAICQHAGMPHCHHPTA